MVVSISDFYRSSLLFHTRIQIPRHQNIPLRTLSKADKKKKKKKKKEDARRALTPGSVFLLWHALTALSASSLEGQIRKQHPASKETQIRSMPPRTFEFELKLEFGGSYYLGRHEKLCLWWRWPRQPRRSPWTLQALHPPSCSWALDLRTASHSPRYWIYSLPSPPPSMTTATTTNLSLSAFLSVTTLSLVFPKIGRLWLYVSCDLVWIGVVVGKWQLQLQELRSSMVITKINYYYYYFIVILKLENRMVIIIVNSEWFE